MSNPLSDEHHEQVVVINWARANAYREPALDYLHAIPNGAKLPFRLNDRGERYSLPAQKLKAEGLLPGVPDLFLPAARGGYHGLYLEMKYGKNKPSPEQDHFIGYVQRAGYQAVICYSAEEAITALENYLGF